MCDARVRQRRLSSGRCALALCSVLTTAVLGAAACSLVVDSEEAQCTKDADCLGFGAKVCGARGVCVPAALTDSGSVDTGSVETGTTDPGPVTELQAGHFHTCGRRASGAVVCWGKNDEGQVGGGLDPATNPVVSKPVPVVGITDATQLSTGEADNCVRTKAGSIMCWGANDHGQLGAGTFDTQTTPVAVIGSDKSASVGAGDAFSCAVQLSSRVQCWGLNDVGQLGEGKAPDVEPHSAVPVTVSGLTDATQIALGESHACAVLSSGKVMCWGHNDFQQLGIGPAGDAAAIASSNVPLEVPGITNARSIDLGEKHSCVVSTSNQVLCWGSNSSGQLGLDPATPMSATPVAVPGLTVAKEVSASGDHTCARMESGQVYCWGANVAGEIGVDPATTPLSATPRLVPGLSDVVSITVGNEHSCARLSSNKLVCWGSNASGQLGDGKKEDKSFMPLEVAPLP